VTLEDLVETITGMEIMDETDNADKDLDHWWNQERDIKQWWEKTGKQRTEILHSVPFPVSE
jgi:CBS domain containing-hemolysin-like protein